MAGITFFFCFLLVEFSYVSGNISQSASLVRPVTPSWLRKKDLSEK